MVNDWLCLLCFSAKMNWIIFVCLEIQTKKRVYTFSRFVIIFCISSHKALHNLLLTPLFSNVAFVNKRSKSGGNVSSFPVSGPCKTK